MFYCRFYAVILSDCHICFQNISHHNTSFVLLLDCIGIYSQYLDWKAIQSAIPTIAML